MKEKGSGGWITATRHVADAPGNWSDESITTLLDVAFSSLTESLAELGLEGRVLRKPRAIGLIPSPGEVMSREALDECVLRVQSSLLEHASSFANLPYCAFNGGSDVWVDVGNKRVGVSALQAYLGLTPEETLHVGDQFLNTGNDFAARSCSPCAWITSPDETTYILKKMLEFASDGAIDIEDIVERDAGGTQRGGRGKDGGVGVGGGGGEGGGAAARNPPGTPTAVEMHRRARSAGSAAGTATSSATDVKDTFDPYTGEMVAASKAGGKRRKR